MYQSPNMDLPIFPLDIWHRIPSQHLQFRQLVRSQTSDVTLHQSPGLPLSQSFRWGGVWGRGWWGNGVEKGVHGGHC